MHPKLFSLSIALLCLSSTMAQSIPGVNEQVAGYVEDAIRKAKSTLVVDPYGFTLSVKVSKKDAEESASAMYPLDKEGIAGIVERMVVNELEFATYDLEKPMRISSEGKGIVFIAVGLTPETAPQIGYDVTGIDHSISASNSNGYSSLKVHISAQFMVARPNDGSVTGQVYYFDEQGNQITWSDAAFPTSPASAKGRVRYRRLGPGAEHNSGRTEPSTDWRPIGNTSGSDFQITARTPGHYFPSVSLRGCKQVFEKKGEDPEAIVKVEGRISWENRTSAKATQETNMDVYTQFSKGNTVKGWVLDSQNRPVMGKKRIVLEPKDWQHTEKEPSEVETNDEIFEFNDVESGVYYVYVKGQEKKTVVEVCNCKGEGANATYVCTIGGAPGYYITMETYYVKTEDLDAMTIGEYGSSGTGRVKETAKTKIVWQISDIVFVGDNGFSSYLKGIYDFPLEDGNTTTVEYQVPQFSYDDGKWIDEIDNHTSNQVPDASLPRIFQINEEEAGERSFKLSDTFSILPLFDDDSHKKEADISQVPDEGMKNMLQSLKKLAKAAQPLVEGMTEAEDGKILEKNKVRTFTLAELIAAASGTPLKLTDKVVRRTEKQADGMFALDKKTTEGMKKLGTIGGLDFNKMAKTASGGTSNFVMTNNYNRPVTTTITRTITLRKSTDAEVKAANVKDNGEIIEEVMNAYPEGMVKKVVIVF